MRIINIELREVGTCDDLGRRVFNTRDYNRNIISNILEERSNAGLDFTGGVFDDIGHRILRPSSSVESIIELPRGCDERRFIFKMVVEIRKSDIRTEYKLLRGYLDRADILSHKGAIDPDAEFYFDSMIDISYIDAMHHGRRVRTRECSDRYSFLNSGSTNNFTYRDSGEIDRNLTYKITPGGIISRYKNDRPNRLSNEKLSKYSSAELKVTNNSGGLLSAIDITESKNNIPSSFIDTVVNAVDSGYTSAHSDRGYSDTYGYDERGDGLSSGVFNDTMYNTNEHGLSTAKMRATKKTLIADRFFAMLSKDTRVLKLGYLTYDEIESIIYRANDRPEDIISVFRPLKGEHIDYRGDGNPLDMGTQEAIIASIISVNLPALLNDYDYKFCRFTADNYRNNGEFVAFIETLETVDADMDVRNNERPFIYGLEKKILSSLILNDIDIEVSVSCHTYGNCKVSVNYDNKGYEDFNFPVYCSSIYSPTLTEDENVIGRISDDVVGLALDISTMARRTNDNPRLVDIYGRDLSSSRERERREDRRRDEEEERDYDSDKLDTLGY